MGLDMTHDCFRGAYSAFMRWRHALAEAAGYQVCKIEGQDFETILIDWGHYSEEHLLGIWETPPHDPLVILWAHSDCEGVIRPREAALLADALAKLAETLPNTDLGGHVGYLRVTTAKFILGLRQAVAAGEDVGFH